MTIIVAHGRTMVADSFAFNEAVSYPVGAPKITRAPDGSLVGTSGGSAWCYSLKVWVDAGMNFDKLPVFRSSADNDQDKKGLSWLWLRPDQSIWFGEETMQPYPTGAGFRSIGLVSACLIAEGAMLAGADVVCAVYLACERCAFVGGPLQVEYLAPAAQSDWIRTAL